MKQITFPNSGTAATSAFAAGMTVNNPNPGDIVDGEVVASTRNGYFVSIGTKSDAFLSTDECTDELKVGDKTRFLVLKKTESDEEFTLSHKRVATMEQRNAAWTKIAALHQSQTSHARPGYHPDAHALERSLLGSRGHHRRCHLLHPAA